MISSYFPFPVGLYLVWPTRPVSSGMGETLFLVFYPSWHESRKASVGGIAQEKMRRTGNLRAERKRLCSRWCWWQVSRYRDSLGSGLLPVWLQVPSTFIMPHMSSCCTLQDSATDACAHLEWWMDVFVLT